MRLVAPFLFVILLVVVFSSMLLQGQKTTEQPQISQPIKIMLVGDSLTEGHAGDYTWRYRLWKHLRARQVSFDFVGIKTTIQDNKTGKSTHEYRDPNFDQDHDGAWGKQLEGAKGSIIDEMKMAEPDLLVVSLGTNDLLSYMSPADTIADMQEFIVNVRWMNPHIQLVLSLLTPRAVPASDPWRSNMQDYNNRLLALAQQMSTPQSVIVIADPTKGFDPTVDTYDGTHPTPSGEIKIAAVYATALARLGIGGD